MSKIFILEDDPNRIKFFKQMFFNHTLAICTTVKEAKIKIKKEIDWDYIFLDHDLGGRIYVSSNEEETGCTFAKFIVQENIIIWKIIIHSLNILGAENIYQILKEKYNVEKIPFIFLKKDIIK